MKILRLIDRYIDSFEKRIFIFIIFITMYWLWQNIWQLLLFYKVYVITDYESLFNLQAHLSNYESSVLIRIIYYVISNPSLNMAGLYKIDRHNGDCRIADFGSKISNYYDFKCI